VDPVPDQLLLRKSGNAGIEPGPLVLKPGPLTTRTRRQSKQSLILVLSLSITIVKQISSCKLIAQSRGHFTHIFELHESEVASDTNAIGLMAHHILNFAEISLVVQRRNRPIRMI
jgi:hypothetical protein